jgi:UDP-GlcNAc:undecaprenyl-phosphate GlcNAc-1-phosphate transferase
MTTILSAFLLALALSLVLTPAVRMLGVRWGALDVPDARKMHLTPVPRVGGVAIFIAVGVTMAALLSIDSGVSGTLVLDRALVHLGAGAVLCFLTGLIDDFRPLGARVKLGAQILAASVAFTGGNWIAMGFFQSLGWAGGLLSYGLTVFWFLLFVNAVNLIDGLDGLSGGVCFFASMVMMVITLMAGQYVIAMLFAVVGGATLGFLRYNFNPASIFLGDGGSYFLGYSIAGLSIMGNVKEQTGIAVLIPLIAMGVPLFDTLLATVRRFLRGRAIFGPDNRHVHHRLIGMGLTTKRAVLLIYAMTIALCAGALAIVHLKDRGASLVLLILGMGALVLTRKLGYFDLIGVTQLRNWIGDMSHVSGISRDRRAFLDLEIEIRKACSLEELWKRAEDAFGLLGMDHARLYLTKACDGSEDAVPDGSTNRDRTASGHPGPNRRMPVFLWNARAASSEEGGKRIERRVPGEAWFYRVELPLIDDGTEEVLGVLVLSKNHDLGQIGPATLISVEHLRRTLGGALARISAAATDAGEAPDLGRGVARIGGADV